VLRAARQAEGEDRALARLACHRHVTAHHARELAGDGKAEPGSTVSPCRERISLGEILEQFCCCSSDQGPVVYLMRFQVTSAVPPIDAGSVHFNSSPVKETTVRFCSVPVQFGYVLPSTFMVMPLSGPTV
jgi:hypothetical protein